MKNIHVLPTDKPSRLIIYSTLANEFRLLDEPIEDWKHKKNIYITSDEEIKDGDWYLDTFNTQRIKANQFSDHKHYGSACKKIILTTDQDLINDGVQDIDDEFLEWFVKNPSCEEIEVDWVDFSQSYFIKIPKEEPKQETLEEAAKEFYPPKTTDLICSPKLVRDGFLAGAKWQQERMYSEEIVDILDNVRYWETCPNSYKVIIERFLEQFKNN